MFCWDCGRPVDDGSFDCKDPGCFDGLPIETERGVGRPPTSPITPAERTWMDSLVERVPAKDMTGWVVAIQRIVAP